MVNNVKITKNLKKSIYNSIPQQYIRYAGIGPYFIPVFERIYWKRLEMALMLARKFASPGKKLKIGDFGCEFGVLVALLSNNFPYSHIYGIDIYPDEVLKVAEDICNKVSMRRNYYFIRGNIENLSFKPETFHIVFCLDVLEHVSNVVKSCREIKRVIKKEGILIVSVPVEGRLLKILREIYTLGGHLAENDPHWHSDIKNYHEFEMLLSNNFELLESIYVPNNRLIVYDKIFACKKV